MQRAKLALAFERKFKVLQSLTPQNENYDETTTMQLTATAAAYQFINLHCECMQSQEEFNL